MRPLKPIHEPPSDADDSAQWEAIEEATELLLENDPHEALYVLKKIVQDDPKNPYAYYYIGTAMFEVGRFDAAVDAYRAALRLSPKYLAARVGLSHALRIEGETAAAEQQARKALEQAPGDGDALFALGLALASAGDRKSAVRAIRAFLDTNPELEVSLEARAMLEKLGPVDER
ncbi:MAG: tetratricopeptide repeat protein [Myxococcota bacterium]